MYRDEPEWEKDTFSAQWRQRTDDDCIFTYAQDRQLDPEAQKVSQGSGICNVPLCAFPEWTFSFGCQTLGWTIQ